MDNCFTMHNTITCTVDHRRNYIEARLQEETEIETFGGFFPSVLSRNLTALSYNILLDGKLHKIWPDDCQLLLPAASL